MSDKLNDSGLLTPEDRQKVDAWFQEKTNLMGACPICKTRKWQLQSHFVHAPVFYGGHTMMMGGPSYPMIMLACGNCAYLAFFGSPPMGLSATPPKSSKTAGEILKDAASK